MNPEAGLKNSKNLMADRRGKWIMYVTIFSEPDTGDMGIIIEVKYAHDGNLDAACEEALSQVEENGYEDDLVDEGVEHILKYGIACHKKRCKVRLAE